jgi:hypothetical protein
MNRAFQVLAALLLILGLGVASSDSADASHSWGGYHWARTSNPFTLKLGSNLSSAWSPYLVTTSSDWSQSDVLDTTVVPGGTNPRTCRPTAGRVEVCNASYGNTGWLGVAQIWVSGSHITQGTVRVNDTYFNTSTYNKPAWRNFVMCQEVGHTLGLDHQDTNFYNANLGSCMDYTNDPDGTLKGQLDNEHPNQDDFYELDCIYATAPVLNSHCQSDGHTDTFTTVGQSTLPRAGAQGNANLEDPSEWGRLVAVSKDGRIAKYERDFGGGNKVVTFVIRA